MRIPNLSKGVDRVGPRPGSVREGLVVSAQFSLVLAPAMYTMRCTPAPMQPGVIKASKCCTSVGASDCVEADAAECGTDKDVTKPDGTVVNLKDFPIRITTP